MKFHEKNKLSETRLILLQAMQENADFDEMGRDALLKAASLKSTDKNLAISLFVDGKREIIAQYYWQAHIENCEYLLKQSKANPPKGVTLKVNYGLQTFLAQVLPQTKNGTENNFDEVLGANSIALQYTFATLIMPQNLKLLVKNIAQLSDVIWKFSGDTSTDYNYYSKRILLSEVIIEILLFYFQDSSKYRQDTQNFIKGRLERTVSIGKKIGKVKTLVEMQGALMVRVLKILSPYADTPPSKFMGERRLNLKIGGGREFRISPLKVAKILGKNFVDRNFTPQSR